MGTRGRVTGSFVFGATSRPAVAAAYTVFHNGGAVRPEFGVVSAFRRTREVRLKPDTTYYKHMKTAVMLPIV